MQYLDLEEVRAGMVLGRNVRDARGRVLLPAGCALTATQLRTLQEHRIARVPVEPPRECGDAEDAADLESRIDARFRFCDERHPLIHELRRLCRLRGTRPKGETDDD